MLNLARPRRPGLRPRAFMGHDQANPVVDLSYPCDIGPCRINAVPGGTGAGAVSLQVGFLHPLAQHPKVCLALVPSPLVWKVSVDSIWTPSWWIIVVNYHKLSRSVSVERFDECVHEV